LSALKDNFIASFQQKIRKKILAPKNGGKPARLADETLSVYIINIDIRR
jgi:hypothetical protein